jgi:hypothetical protein
MTLYGGNWFIEWVPGQHLDGAVLHDPVHQRKAPRRQDPPRHGVQGIDSMKPVFGRNFFRQIYILFRHFFVQEQQTNYYFGIKIYYLWLKNIMSANIYKLFTDHLCVHNKSFIKSTPGHPPLPEVQRHRLLHHRHPLQGPMLWFLK